MSVETGNTGVINNEQKSRIAKRFRGFLPVVVDVETGGFNPLTDALLEIAAVTLTLGEQGLWRQEQTIACHVQPFPGANLDPVALEFTGIDPYHPFRLAVPEEQALQTVFSAVHKAIETHGCSRAILVGHNPAFDLAFIKAAIKRTGIKPNPFHSFSTFDTVTLAGLAFGQTVLSRAVIAAGLEWDHAEAHSAIYDAERTADLFCAVINQWEVWACADKARAVSR
ncbi:MAG TPA: ribonuclease T [Gammaproteobacteria bacterium]|nr:ribonuclease T [Gammaproteobacteria bacterium]